MYSPASPWAPVHNKIARLCWYKVGVGMGWVLKYEEKKLMKLRPKRSNTAYTAVVNIPSPFMLFLHPTQRFKGRFRSHTLQYQP